MFTGGRAARLKQLYMETKLMKSGDSTLWHTSIYAYLTSWVYLTDHIKTELLEQEIQLLHSESDKLQMKKIHQVFQSNLQDHSLHCTLLLQPGTLILTVLGSPSEDGDICLGKLQRSLLSPEAFSTSRSRNQAPSNIPSPTP